MQTVSGTETSLKKLLLSVNLHMGIVIDEKVSEGRGCGQVVSVRDDPSSNRAKNKKISV